MLNPKGTTDYISR